MWVSLSSLVAEPGKPGIVGVDIVKLIMMLDATALDVRDTYDWAIILGGTK